MRDLVAAVIADPDDEVDVSQLIGPQSRIVCRKPDLTPIEVLASEILDTGGYLFAHPTLGRPFNATGPQYTVTHAPSGAAIAKQLPDLLAAANCGREIYVLLVDAGFDVADANLWRVRWTRGTMCRVECIRARWELPAVGP